MVRVRVLYFSIIRDFTGVKEEDVEVKGATVADLLAEIYRKYGKLAEWAKEEEVIVVINGEVKGPNYELREGDEVAIVPPLSGGACAGFVDEIKPGEEIKKFVEALPPDVGAVAVFVGVVKGLMNNKKVASLFYEVYEPHSSKSLVKIVKEEVAKRGLATAEILHKKGLAMPGEPVLFVAVASRGRKEVLSALPVIVERVKKEALVWKLEKREDGEYWIIGEKRVKRDTR